MDESQRERRSDPERKQFNAAVQQAARLGAAQALRERRPLLITLVVGSGALIALLALVIWWFAIARPYGQQNAVYDCRLFTNAAELLSNTTSHIGQFVSSDANLRTRQNQQGLNGKLTADFQKIIDARTLSHLAAQQHNDVVRTVKGWRKDANAIKSDARSLATLAGTDCLRHLGG